MSDLQWTNCTVRLSDLRPWADNPRMSTKAQAKRLLKSFEKFGQVQTIGIGPQNEVYDGHQRLSALLTIHGGEYEVDARRSNRPLTDDERRELVAALHLGAFGSWDWDKLSTWDAPVLQEWGGDKDTLKGWKSDVNNLNEFINANEQEPVDVEPQIDRAEELQAKWKVKTGDLWQIGEHRLLCGDSTKQEDVERLVGVNAFCVLTDPPYNIGFSYNSMDDEMTSREYEDFCSAWFGVVSDAVCIIFSPGPKNTRLYPIPRDVGYWLKRNASAGASAFNLRTIEPLLIYGKIGHKRNFDMFDYSSGFPDELRAAQRAALVEDKHPPAKPIGLWLDIIDMFPDELPIVDVFSGNGTTFMAAAQKNRICFGMERDASYCGVILERMSQAFPELEIKRIGESDGTP